MNLRLVLISMLLSAFSIPVVAAEGGSSVFSQLNLDYPGLEGVKSRHAKGDDAAAADSLLAYFRSRKNAGTPELPSLQGITITAQQQKIADEALEHRFFVHYGYQPSYFYGDDITKSDVSHIEFNFFDDAKNEDQFSKEDIKEAFSWWDQETLNKINNISIYYSYDHEGNASFIQTGEFEIVIDRKSYKMEYEYDKYDNAKILSSSLKSKDPDTANIFFYIAQLYKEKYS